MNIQVSIEKKSGHPDYEDGIYYDLHDITREIVATGPTESEAWASYARLIATYEYLRTTDGNDTLNVKFTRE